MVLEERSTGEVTGTAIMAKGGGGGGGNGHQLIHAPPALPPTPLQGSNAPLPPIHSPLPPLPTLISLAPPPPHPPLPPLRPTFSENTPSISFLSGYNPKLLSALSTPEALTSPPCFELPPVSRL